MGEHGGFQHVRTARMAYGMRSRLAVAFTCSQEAHSVRPKGAGRIYAAGGMVAIYQAAVGCRRRRRRWQGRGRSLSGTVGSGITARSRGRALAARPPRAAHGHVRLIARACRMLEHGLGVDAPAYRVRGACAVRKMYVVWPDLECYGIGRQCVPYTLYIDKEVLGMVETHWIAR